MIAGAGASALVRATVGVSRCVWVRVVRLALTGPGWRTWPSSCVPVCAGLVPHPLHLPLTVLMVAYTAVSLSVIAGPMLRFLPEPAQAAFMAFGIAGFKSGDGWKALPGAHLRE
jgi:hypothetical protein